MKFSEFQEKLDELPPLPKRILIPRELTGVREGASDRIKAISAAQVDRAEALKFENHISYGPRSRAA